MKRTLITGHKGFIGSKLFTALFNEGFNPIGVDLREGKNLLTCDLPDDIELVYHLAAQSSVEASWSDPLHDLDNIRMTARLVHKYPNAKIVYVNSCASQNPASPYGFSKKMAGEYIKTFQNDYVICTLTNVFGPGSRSVVDIFKGRKDVIIYGDGLQTRDYIHVDDVVKGLLKAKDWPLGEYSFSTGRSYSVLELAEGKYVDFRPARREDREVKMENTTPDWTPSVDVIQYMKQ